MRKKSKRGTTTRCWLFVITLFFSFTSFAQTHRIVGKITSADDSQPLPGATVKIKGTAVVANSNASGMYGIDAKTGDVLVFSFTGFKSSEVTVTAANTINISLTNTTNALNEVVVIGYGTARRKDLTGAIASISSSDIEKTVSTTFDQALQGRVAGVSVIQNSGQPGAGVSIQVRGLGSINAGVDPLYVIDGVIIPPGQPSSTGGVYMGNSGTRDNPLSTINPNDIASIDVLKDASAIAIYGSQGSNGVVIITTKRGKAGAPKISFDNYYGVQQVPKYLPMMNLQQYATFLNARATVTGATPNPDFVNPQYLGTGTDWQRAIFKNAGMYNANLSVSGGDDRTTYYIGGSYLTQDGTVLSSNFKRTALKVNLDNKTTNWLKIGTSLTFSGIKENVNASVYDLINATLNLPPNVAPVNPDGSIGAIPTPGQTVANTYNPNPIAAAAMNTNKVQRSQAYGNFYGDIIFTKDLKLHNEATGNFDYGNVNQFYPTFTINGILNPVNSAAVTATNNKSFTIRNYFSYDHYAASYSINATAGHEASSGTYTYLSGGRTGFFANNPQDLSLGNAATASNSGGSNNYSNESYLARVTAGYLYKYNLTATYRKDGNSNFADGKRWVGTYAFGGSWNAEKENFLKGVKAIDQLKLRLSYGLTNNANLPAYTYGSSIATGTVGLGQGALVLNIANPNVQWETSKSLDAGLDISFLKNRIQLTADVYNRKTNNLLLQIPLPGYAGTNGSGSLSAPWGNIGSIQNKGFEFTLNTRNIQSTVFSWNTTLTFSLNRNKILSLNDANGALYGKINNASVIVSRTAVGSSIGDFYGYVAQGVFKNAADLKSSALPAGSIIDYTQGIWVGDTKYKDLNKDGVIDANDMTNLGSPLPKFTYGINNSFSFKGFDMTIFFTGSYGNKILNYNKVLHEDPNSGTTGYFASLTNYAQVALIDPTGSKTGVNNVSVTNPGTSVPGFRVSGDPNQNYRISSRFIEDGSYLRLKNLAVGYNLPTSIVAKLHVHSLRVYSNIQNLFTISKYTGYDPEIGTNVPNQSGQGTNALTSGIDWGRYPTPRIYTFGFNVGL